MSRKRRSPVRAALVPTLAGLLFAAAGLAALADPIGLPAGFEDRLVLEGLNNPVDIVFLPSGRALVGQKSGVIYLVSGREVQYPPIRTLSVNGELDRGLQSMLLDPAFPVEPYLYVLYTRGGADLTNWVSRFELSDNPGEEGVRLSNELVLLQGLDSTGRMHSGGGLVFGPDGYLYVATGDGGFGSVLSQETDRLEGKILRITREGEPAPGNPFAGVPGYRPEIYCTGLRNPFRMAVHPGTGAMYVNDVGFTTFEEVNRVFPGANFGWPLEEGPGSSYASPLYSYDHDQPSNAITGGLFYEGSEYPVLYQGDYFFADFGHGSITRLVLDDGTGEIVSSEIFATGYATATSLRVGPDDAMYVVCVLTGEIHKIVYVGNQNRPPHATIVTSPTSGIAPITVELVAANAADPDGDSLRFTWRIDGGAPITRQSPSLFRNFTQPRTYRIDLTVDDGRGGVRAMPPYFFDANNEPPVPSITAPAPESTYAAGDVVAIAGGATDLEDGALGSAALSWTIVFHHHDHTHPFLGPITHESSGNVTIPRIGEPAPDTAYEIRLTARDSGGATRTESIFIRPRLVEVTLESDPPGLAVKLDGIPTPTPFTFVGIEGFERELRGVNGQVPEGFALPYAFRRIEGQASGPVRVRLPATTATYRALYKPFHPY